MKSDDPKLTAFALGELPPAERPTVEAELAAHPEFAVEVKETKEMAGILRKGLRGEPAGELASHQRDAIFRAARVAQPAIIPASERPATLVLPKSKWWDRPGPWQAIAACAVLGLGIYATSVNLSKPGQKGRLADSAEISVAVPTDGMTASANLSEPEILSPKQGDASPSIGRTGIDPARTIVQTPDMKRTLPNVQVDPPPALVPQPPDGSKALAGNTAQANQAPVRRGPHVTGIRNPELANALAGADVGRSESRQVVMTDSVVSDSVKVVLQEVGRMREGSAYADFALVFRPVAGVAGRYEMIRWPSVKVDAEFLSADGQPLTTPPAPESKVKKVSKPYLETE